MVRMILGVAVLVLAAGWAGAGPEEEVAALRDEVAALKAEVAALRAELAALREEVAKLRPPPEPPPAPPPPEEPVPPPAPPPVPAEAGPAGTWTLDREAFAADLGRDRIARLKTILDGVPEAERGRYLAMVREQVAAEAKEAMLKVVLRPDGTWTMEAGFQGLLSTAQGTWRAEGERLLVHRTHLNGAPSPEDREVALRDGRIALPPAPPVQTIPVTLVRQD